MTYNDPIMHKITLTEAKHIYDLNDRGVYLLFPDNSESLIESRDTFKDHYVKTEQIEFGYEVNNQTSHI